MTHPVHTVPSHPLVLGERRVYVGSVLAILGLLAVIDLRLGFAASVALVCAVAGLLRRRRPGLALAVAAVAGLAVITLGAAWAADQDLAAPEQPTVDLGAHRVPVRLSDGSVVWLDPVVER